MSFVECAMACHVIAAFVQFTRPGSAWCDARDASLKQRDADFRVFVFGVANGGLSAGQGVAPLGDLAQVESCELHFSSFGSAARGLG